MSKKTKPTLVCFVLDETGSMMDCYLATISAFNEYIKTLRGVDKMRMTLIQFNSFKMQTVFEGKPITDVPDLTMDTYKPNQTTPLYDAVGRAIRSTETVLKKKEQALVVIQTDGEENSSTEFSFEKIKALMDKKRKEGWEFVFMGADFDAWVVASNLGVSMASVLNYSKQDTDQAFRAAGASTVSFASGNLSPGGFFSEDKDSKKTS